MLVVMREVAAGAKQPPLALWGSLLFAMAGEASREVRRLLLGNNRQVPDAANGISPPVPFGEEFCKMLWAVDRQETACQIP